MASEREETAAPARRPPSAAADDQGAAHAADETLELKVDNMSFLLERLGSDCAPDQLVRELTVNAIQAIQDTGGPGVVVWDHEPTYTKRCGAYKLAVADTGIGMTGPEMVRYINHLAASAREQADDRNFGVGAKIAAATRNPAGMVYLSWKRGRGAMVWLWRNPETGRYGLRRLSRPERREDDEGDGGADGDSVYWAPAPPGAKPDFIEGHGTVVVLLGEREGADTMREPGADATSRDGDGRADDGAASGRSAGRASPDEPSDGLWLVRYLNARFFEFPAGIEVRARERWGTPASRLRRVDGVRRFLDDAAEASGRVDLGDAVARWWILPADGVPDVAAARHPAGGHVGALYQDELYERYTGRSGTAKLQSFGIAVGHDRVVLYVEPKTDGRRRVASNTARTALLLDGRPLPWGDWAGRFREELPEPLLALMDEVASAQEARDHTRSFKERMKGLANLLLIGGGDPEAALRRLFAPDRGRRPASDRVVGADRAPDIDPTDAAAVVDDEPGADDERDDGRADDDRDIDERPAEDRRDDGARADDDADVAPVPGDAELDRLLDLDVAWVSESESGAADRAGHYIPETNTLLMNRDFRVFAEYIDRWRAKYEDNPAAQREVEDVVREWLEQPLRELIIRSHFLRGTDGWSEDDLRVLLSDEALTAVSLPCYLTEMRLRRAVSQRLGRLRPARAA